MTFGRATKSVLLLDDGAVIGCGLTYRTMMSRLNGDAPLEAEAEPALGTEAEDAE